MKELKEIELIKIENKLETVKQIEATQYALDEIFNLKLKLNEIIEAVNKLIPIQSELIEERKNDK